MPHACYFLCDPYQAHRPVERVAFTRTELITVREALDIAEDATGNFFKGPIGQPRRSGYDLKTLSMLSEDEISSFALAVLNRGKRTLKDYEPRSKTRDFYYICLQDHMILGALQRDRNLALLPFLIYILTHELVHIVRFCKFLQRFDVTERERVEEEEVVHSLTFEILKRSSVAKLHYVLNLYRGHRMCQFHMS